MERLRDFYMSAVLDECSNFAGEFDNLRNNFESNHPQLFDEEQFNYGAYLALLDTKDAIVGTIGIEPSQEDRAICMVNVFAVDKDCRNCGFGKILLDIAIDLSRQLRFKTITMQAYNNHSKGVSVMRVARHLALAHNFTLKDDP